MNECENGARRLTKNEKRRQREKTKPREQNHEAKKTIEENNDVIIEYVAPEFNSDSIFMEEFQQIFDKFGKVEDLISTSTHNEIEIQEQSLQIQPKSELPSEPVKLSKKKKKLASRLSVAELKQLVQRPDVVEAHDVTSSDPRLLVYLKAYRNTVPVPRHWCLKRRYLQGKRGIEKPPFALPEFIADTGIGRIRESIQEQDAAKKSKQKARDRLQPKMGRIDIDYQVLHDAFFKYQTKPKMTIHGDLYYESKEYEVQVRERKPGILSSELLAALGMTDATCPPPWLINMQRYGPPPSYPFQRIPGLNAPIPNGASFGYNPGQWGKPPVDEMGRPLYGNVFGGSGGAGGVDPADAYWERDLDKSHRWGQIIAFEEEEEQEEDEEEEEEEVGEEEEAGRDKRKIKDSDLLSGSQTPSSHPQLASGTSSTLSSLSGLETPDSTFELRKRSSASLSSVPAPASVPTPASAPKELFQVLSEGGGAGGGSQLFESDKTYVLPSTSSSGLSDQQFQEGLDSQVSLASSVFTSSASVAESEEGKKRKKKSVEASAALKKAKDFKF